MNFEGGGTLFDCQISSICGTIELDCMCDLGAVYATGSPTDADINIEVTEAGPTPFANGDKIHCTPYYRVIS